MWATSMPFYFIFTLEVIVAATTTEMAMLYDSFLMSPHTCKDIMARLYLYSKKENEKWVPFIDRKKQQK